MSGQCLSPNDAGHALTPATHRRLGEPLPHQLTNRTQSRPQAESHLWSGDVIWYYLSFPKAIPVPGVGNYALLSLSPLEYCYSRSTCMPNPRRQRSFWARIKPFNYVLLSVDAYLVCFQHWQIGFCQIWLFITTCWLYSNSIKVPDKILCFMKNSSSCQRLTWRFLTQVNA